MLHNLAYTLSELLLLSLCAAYHSLNRSTLCWINFAATPKCYADMSRQIHTVRHQSNLGRILNNAS